MSLKTKDILKILKLVKKSKKAKKRRSKHKKKINITTQQIAPSTLQPYEISRQPFNNTNNVQLENIRLSNKMLENKLNAPDNNNNIKALEDKLNLAIGYNNLQDKVNLTTSSISDIKNENMDLSNKINRVIDFGQNFVAETNRKFNDHQLKQDVQQPVIDSNEVEDQQPEVKTNEANEKPDDNFVYKKIRNDKIVRALLKQIETKPSRKLSEEEKNVLKPFYKKYNVSWASNTQSTSGVKKQLQKFIL
jgi:hypothetical protein